MNYSNFAKKYEGVKEGSSKHKYIIDEYNKIRPLPRNYKVSYSDAWCATFVSFVLYKNNAKYPCYECSVYYMWLYCKQNLLTVKTANVKANDIIFYDWYNNGTYDHVGIISKVSGNTLTVIEGNKNDAVGYRTIDKYNSQIIGFARIPQKSITKKKSDLNKVVEKVINGDYGNYPERKTRLEKDGYNYEEVQKLVNEKLKG